MASSDPEKGSDDFIHKSKTSNDISSSIDHPPPVLDHILPKRICNGLSVNISENPAVLLSDSLLKKDENSLSCNIVTEDKISLKNLCDLDKLELNSVIENVSPSEESSESFKDALSDCSDKKNDLCHEENEGDAPNLTDHEADSLHEHSKSCDDSNSTNTDSDENTDTENNEEIDDDDDDSQLRNERICKSLDKYSIKSKNNIITLLQHRQSGKLQNEQFSRKSIPLLHYIQRLEPYSVLDKHEGCVNSLHFNETGTLLASGSDDSTIVIWNWERKKPYVTYDSGHTANVFQSKFLNFTNDSVIVSASRDGQIRYGDISSAGECKGTRKLAQHKGPSHKLSLFDDDCHQFLSCGEDGAVFCIDCRESKPNQILHLKGDNNKDSIPLYSIHSNPMNSWEFCTAGRDPKIRVFDRRKLSSKQSSGGKVSTTNMDKAEILKEFSPEMLLKTDESSNYKVNVTCAVYNYNGTEILGTYNDDDIYLFNANHSNGADHIHRYSGHRNNATVKNVNFYGPESEYIVSGSDCGKVFIWEKNSEAVVNYFEADEGGVVNVLEAHPHLPVLATSGLDSSVKLWMATAHESNSLENLEKHIKNNWIARVREKGLFSASHMINGHLLYSIMRNLRAQARRSAREAGETDEESSIDDIDSQLNDDDNDNETDNSRFAQCAPQ